MSRSSNAVKKWRAITKSRIVEAMGGSCVICGYNKCHAALVTHHLDPSKKDFSLAGIRANIKSWATIVNELKKCVLVCHNCHAEIHYGGVVVPENCKGFNQKYENYQSFCVKTNNCVFCKTQIPAHKKHCSVDCSAKSKYKVDWDRLNLVEELKNKSIVKLAKELGCSDAAIHKRLKKLGLKNK